MKENRLKIYWQIILLLGMGMLWGCQQVPTVGQKTKSQEIQTSSNEYLMAATLWYRQAAETRALIYQAFQLAQLKLEGTLSSSGVGKKASKPLAIVVDIDETILDNSPYQARNILENRSYPQGWKEWVELEQAKALPGAKDFLQLTHSKGVAIFYISNRLVSEFDATLRNLIKEGLPVEKEKLLLRETTSNKKERREKVFKTHNVLLLLGDNLNDFSEDFEKKSVSQRFELTDRLKREFGQKFIVFPNPMYGDWEAAIYQYKWDKSKEELNHVRRESLMGDEMR